ncbi:MAG: hypothetical protein CM15mP126_6290 [Gammaproteobacteria bacterium]|nr:MAG: hypothetical protein CM15mP126_6290 [Gammaproteobacteria bacterium]
MTEAMQSAETLYSSDSFAEFSKESMVIEK